MADKVLCDGSIDFTGGGSSGYGCSQRGSLLAVNSSAVGEEAVFLCC